VFGGMKHLKVPHNMNASCKLVIGLLGGFTAMVISGAAATIGLDTRNPDISENLSGRDYDEFRATITAAGHNLVYLTSFTTTDLAGMTALVVVQPFYESAKFTTNEISAIHSFVEAGHGLLLIAEGGSETALTVENFNSLCGPFGVTYANTVLHADGYTVTGFVAHPVTLGVNSIGVDYDRRLIGIVNPATNLTLLSGENDILAAVIGTNGGGNVVFVSDPTMWTDRNVQDGRDIAFGDNRRLLQNIISFITPPQLSVIRVGAEQLRLSWGTHFSGYELQQSPEVAGAEWSPVTNTVSVASNLYSVTIHRNSAQQFFRLRKF
jgi:hypothetical protein